MYAMIKGGHGGLQLQIEAENCFNKTNNLMTSPWVSGGGCLQIHQSN